MKIVYKSKKPDYIDFGDVFVGQTFYDQEGDLCIKINKTGCVSGYNGLCLSNNNVYSFSDCWKVIPVESELIVDAEEA